MTYFLARYEGECWYLELKGFECNHYFSGLHICSPSSYGYNRDIRQAFKEDYQNVETKATQEEIEQLFALDDKLQDLGYGIEKDGGRYNEGMTLLNAMQELLDKINTKNEPFFNDVIVPSEKEKAMSKYDLSEEEIEETWEHYPLSYKYNDSGMISTIFNDTQEMVEEEKFSFGYSDFPYFDDEAFKNALLDGDTYYQLSTGKIVYYCM